MIFPAAGNNEKNIFIMKKKKLLCRTIFGLLHKIYCEIFFFFFCIASLAIVLQERGLEKKNVVKIVLQYHYCIVGGVRLYCSIGRKIVL